MENQIIKLKEEFIKIKKMGWIKSVNRGSNGVGFTLESLFGISKNELEIPDYNGIELKARRYSSTSYIILFSCKPEGKYYHEVERIKDEYGYPHSIFNEYKVLNNSVYANKKNKIGNNYYFKLDVSRIEERIYLLIYDINNKLLERTVYWDFDVLKEKLYRKLKWLALIKAYSKKSCIEQCEYFKYEEMKIYCLKNFSTFIHLLEKGIIRVNFKLNIKTKGDKIGQIHDHGTSFDIKECDLVKLFDILKS